MGGWRLLPRGRRRLRRAKPVPAVHRVPRELLVLLVLTLLMLVLLGLLVVALLGLLLGLMLVLLESVVLLLPRSRRWR